jgi:hypothetical protein
MVCKFCTPHALSLLRRVCGCKFTRGFTGCVNFAHPCKFTASLVNAYAIGHLQTLAWLMLAIYWQRTSCANVWALPSKDKTSPASQGTTEEQIPWISTHKKARLRTESKYFGGRNQTALNMPSTLGLKAIQQHGLHTCNNQSGHQRQDGR